MLAALRRSQFASQLPRNVRCFSEAVASSSTTQASSSSASAAAPPPPPAGEAAPSARPKLHYYVPRNERGNLPVYSDVRNAGSRYLVLIRNVEGNIAALGKDLAKTLFPPESHEASRLNITFRHSKHIVITGGRWVEDVKVWLKNKGF